MCVCVCVCAMNLVIAGENRCPTSKVWKKVCLFIDRSSSNKNRCPPIVRKHHIIPKYWHMISFLGLYGPVIIMAKCRLSCRIVLVLS